MNLDQATIEALAERLDKAATELKPITKITDEYPEMEWDDAYAIQYALRDRIFSRGGKLGGMKMGLTSHAKMKQMGVDVACYGFLNAHSAYAEGADIPAADFIHPRIEAEVAAVTKAPLRGPGCHLGQVLAAIDFVMPAVEIIDSRYENFRFDLKSVVADNTSAAGFVTGGRTARPTDVDLRTMGVVLEKNGAVVETGAGAAVLGHPANAIAMLANMLAARGEEIPAGTFIMTGGITAAVAVEPGDSFSIRYQGLGSLSMRFV